MKTDDSVGIDISKDFLDIHRLRGPSLTVRIDPMLAATIGEPSEKLFTLCQWEEDSCPGSPGVTRLLRALSC